MSLLPLPHELHARWHRLDVPGRESARIQQLGAELEASSTTERAQETSAQTRTRAHASRPTLGSGWRLSGELEVEETGLTAHLRYAVDCDHEWCTRSARVEGTLNGTPLRFTLASDGAGAWSQDALPLPALAGAMDMDFGFTPATNTLPIRRLALAVGESALVRSAWLRFPELRLELLEQTYARESPDIFRYAALVDGQLFTAQLRTDPFGRVVRYGDLWEMDLRL